MEELPTPLIEKNHPKTYAEMRADKDNIQPLTPEDIDRLIINFRELATILFPNLTEDIAEANTRIDSLPVLNRETLGIEAYPADPKALPVPTAAEQLFEQKADFVDPNPTLLTHTSNVFTLDYDPGKPVYRINLGANGTVQINGLNKLTSGQCILYVKKTLGSATLAFRDINTPITPFVIGTVRTNNGEVDRYEIEKIDTRYYITQTPLGLGTEEPNATVTEYEAGLVLSQGVDGTGKLYVQAHFNQHPQTVQYKLIRNELSTTATAPTVTEVTVYPSGGNIRDYGPTSAAQTAVIQKGKTYHYGLRISLNGVATWYRASITVS